MTIFNLPRHERTPQTEIDLILSNLSVLFNEMFPNRDKYEFINVWRKRFYEDENLNGDVLASDQHNIMNGRYGESAQGTSRYNPEASMFVSLAYLCHAQRAWDDERERDAWTYVVDAKVWSERVLTRAKRVDELKRIDHERYLSRVRSESRKKGIEKYDYSEFILNEYKKQPWKNKADAANKISVILREHIEKNDLPVRYFHDDLLGKIIDQKQEDFYNLVLRNLPSAKQVREDRDKFGKN